MTAEVPNHDVESATSAHSDQVVSGRVVSGRAVVLGLATFSVLMVASLFVYWELYTRPFRPLQDAIAARFPESSPRVVAGRHKSHLSKSPYVLRIVLRVKEDPREHDGAMRHRVNELRELLQPQADLSTYDQIEIHLTYRQPETYTITWSVKAPPEAFPLPIAGDLPSGVSFTLDTGHEGS